VEKFYLGVWGILYDNDSHLQLILLCESYTHTL